MLRRRRRSLLLAVLLLLAVGIGAGALRGDPEARPAARVAAPVATATATATGPALLRPIPGGQPGPSASAAAPPAAPAPVSTSYPATAAGTFGYADTAGAVLGAAGTLRRFRVAVEDGMGQDPAGFARSVDTVLGDPRSWIASRQLRLQRVPRAAAADFTVFLASPATSQRMCATGGLDTDGFTSCRLPGQVIINVARWLTAIPDYGAPTTVYQAYAVNHEVGHQLGHGHEACPGPGRPAPVMQQQTYGLKGCLANPWPYLDGARYTGPATRGS